MKKIACILLCLVTQAIQAKPTEPHTFTGGYISFGVGATQVDFSSSPALGAGGSDFFIGDFTIYSTSAAGQVGFSYLYQFGKQFVLGGEATAAYTNAHANYRNVVIGKNSPPFDQALISSQLQSRYTNDFALLIKPGIVVRDVTMFYAVFGPRWASYQNVLFTDVELIGTTEASAVGTDRASDYDLGFTAGLGIQQILMDHVHLSMQYAFTHFGQVVSPYLNAQVVPHQTSGQTSVPDSRVIDSNTNSIWAILSYHW